MRRRRRIDAVYRELRPGEREGAVPMATWSERGFGHWPPVTDSYHGTVRVYESSSVSPHIWLAIDENHMVLTDPTPGEAHAHLSIVEAHEVHAYLGRAIRHTMGQSRLEHFLRGHPAWTWMPTLDGPLKPLWPVYKWYAWWRERRDC